MTVDALELVARIRECMAVHQWATPHAGGAPCAFCTGLAVAILSVEQLLSSEGKSLPRSVWQLQAGGTRGP